MRIGISVKALYRTDGSPKAYDGLGSYTKMLIQGLSENHHIEPLVMQNALESLTHLVNPKPCSNPRLTIVSNPVYQTFLPFALPDYESFESKIDIFHSTDYYTPKFKKIPVVSTIQDAIMFAPELVRKNLKLKLGRHVLRAFAKNATQVIAPTQAVLPDLVEKFGIPSHKISVVPNGIDNVWYTPSHEKIEQIRSLYHIQKPYFLVIGTLQPRKNIARILEAYQASSESFRKSYTVLFVGSRGWLDPATFQKLEAMQAKQDIQWLKHIPFEHVRCLYQHAQAILFPSLAEGFGYPVVEGFASGTPVITSHYGSTAELAGDAAILVDPTQVESIVAGMEKIVQDQKLRASLIEKGYKRSKLYSIENCIAGTVAVYKKALGS